MNEKEELKQQIKELQRKLAKLENEPILTKKEKAYLSAVIKPFRDNILNITKWGGNENYEYLGITLDVKGDADILLPLFDRGKYYKGMEQCKRYTLKELGLDKDIEPPISEKQKIYDQLKRYAEEHNTEPINWKEMKKHYNLFFDTFTGKIKIEANSSLKTIGNIYFTSYEIAQESVKEIGKDNIKKLFEEE